MASPATKEPARWRAILSRRVLVNLLFGFSSGLPLLAIGGTLQAWATEAGLDLKVIGLFSLVGLPYTLKFLWAPLFDAVQLPFLGQRRGWIALTQLALMAALVLLATVLPLGSTTTVAGAALLVAFCSASQDIVLDAYRRDSLHDRELGIGSAFFINGYRLGMLVSGAVALKLAVHLPWMEVYTIIAGCVLVGLLTTIFVAEEPPRAAFRARTLQDAVVVPLADFLRRRGALLLLLFILLYKLGDVMAAALSTTFFLKTGYSKDELAYIGKIFGLAATIGGGFAGGLFILRAGIPRALLVFGILQAFSVASNTLIAVNPPDWRLLAFVIGFENLASGMGTAAYSAFMASLCNRKFSATQYALLSSLMGVPRVLLSSPLGWVAESLGWFWFFVLSTACAVPGLLMIGLVTRLAAEEPASGEEATTGH